MKKNLVLLFLMPVALFAQLVFPAKDFTLKMKNIPQKSLGGMEALVSVRESTMQVNGKSVPCREIEMKYSRKNVITLEYVCKTPVDLMDQWHELVSHWQIDGEVHVNNLTAMSIANAAGERMPAPRPVKKDNLYELKWDPMHEPVLGRQLRDMSTLTKITITLKMDSWENHNAPCIFRFSDFTVTDNDHWAHQPEVEKKWRAWLKHKKEFRADYSDSSKYLLPPEEGRIAEPLYLVKDGKANGEIILYGDNPYKVLNWAAHDFANHVKKITGATIPVLDKPGNAPVKIFLNSPEAAKRYPEEMAYLADLKPHYGEDGYLIRTEKNNIYINGHHVTGARNGLFRLLENNTDIIWARTVDGFGTVYSQNPDLKILWAHALFKPMTPFRGWRGLSSAGNKWAARNGSNDSIAKQYGGARDVLYGNFSDYLPNKPPYQCYVNGEYLPMGYYKSQVCISQPDTYDRIINKMVDRVKAAQKEGRKITQIFWGIEDNWYVCTCSGCTAPITLPDGTVLVSTGESHKGHMKAEEVVFRCNQFYLMANRLAKGLQERCPGVNLGILAYFFMEPMPKFKLEKNIQLMFAPLYTRGDFLNPIFAPTNNHVRARRDAIVKGGAVLDLYEYYFSAPISDLLQADIPEYIDSGFSNFGSEITEEGRSRGNRGAWDFAAMDYWCFIRLTVDYKQNLEQLRKFFIRRVFRSGAPAVERFYGLIHEGVFSKPIRGGHPNYINFMREYIFKPGHGGKLLEDLKKGLAAEKVPQARINLGRFIQRYEAHYEQWLIQTGKKPKPKINLETTLPPDTVNHFLDTLNTRWDPHSEIAATCTTFEYKGRFFDGIRFRYTPRQNLTKKQQEKNRLIRAHSVFHAKRMGSKEPIPFPGIITVKVRVLTPCLDPKKIPFFGITSSPQQSEVNRFEQIMPIGKNLYEITFAPEGKYVNLNDFNGFIVQLPREWVDPAKGYAEFEFFDFQLKKITNPTKDDLGDDLLDDLNLD